MENQCPQILGNTEKICTNSRCGFFVKDQEDCKNCGILINIAWVDATRLDMIRLKNACEECHKETQRLLKGLPEEGK
ncbi:hypothetical protein K8T06_10465 [bacterium]|nr:hypothetical protein [bacterium]